MENVTNSNIGDTNGSHPLQCTKFPEFQEHLDICQECPDLIFLTVTGPIPFSRSGLKPHSSNIYVRAN